MKSSMRLCKGSLKNISMGEIFSLGTKNLWRGVPRGSCVEESSHALGTDGYAACLESCMPGKEQFLVAVNSLMPQAWLTLHSGGR